MAYNLPLSKVVSCSCAWVLGREGAKERGSVGAWARGRGGVGARGRVGADARGRVAAGGERTLGRGGLESAWSRGRVGAGTRERGCTWAYICTTNNLLCTHRPKHLTCFVSRVISCHILFS